MYVFKCRYCGEICCSFSEESEMPLIFPWEKKLLERQNRGLKLEFKPYIVYRGRNGYYIVVLYRWIIRGKCPFLEENGKCSIHSIKPLACKMFPLVIGLDDDTLRVSRGCKVVEEDRDKILSSDPSKVFRDEYYYALKTFILLKTIEEMASINGWVREEITGDKILEHVVDLDEVLDMDSLLLSIDSQLDEIIQRK